MGGWAGWSGRRAEARTTNTVMNGRRAEARTTNTGACVIHIRGVAGAGFAAFAFFFDGEEEELLEAVDFDAEEGVVPFFVEVEHGGDLGGGGGAAEVEVEEVEVAGAVHSDGGDGGVVAGVASGGGAGGGVEKSGDEEVVEAGGWRLEAGGLRRED